MLTTSYKAIDNSELKLIYISNHFYTCTCVYAEMQEIISQSTSSKAIGTSKKQESNAHQGKENRKQVSVQNSRAIR